MVNAAGANGVMILPAEVIRQVALDHFATMIFLMPAVEMGTAMGLHQRQPQGQRLDPLRQALRQAPLDLHPHHTRHTHQLLPHHQALVAWNFWATWKIGVQTLSGGMRTCLVIA